MNVNHSEGATSDNRANIHLRLHPNISYNKVTLREKDDRLSSTIPTDQSSQTDSERETPLDTTPVSEGNNQVQSVYITLIIHLNTKQGIIIEMYIQTAL